MQSASLRSFSLSIRLLVDQHIVQRPPARRVGRQQQAARDLARRIGRSVQPRAETAGLPVNELARRMIPGIEAIIEREMRLAARQREVLMTGATEIEDRADRSGVFAEATGKPTVDEP